MNNPMEIKYLQNGARISVIAEIEQGVLVRNVVCEDGECWEEGLIYLVNAVYDKAKPIQYFDSKILECKETIKQLNREIRLLKQQREQLQNQLATMKRPKLHINF